MSSFQNMTDSEIVWLFSNCAVDLDLDPKFRPLFADTRKHRIACREELHRRFKLRQQISDAEFRSQHYQVLFALEFPEVE